MRRYRIIACIVALVCLTAPASARQRINFTCALGGARVYVSNVGSADPAPSFRPTQWMRSYGGATATVYLTGTSSLATIYADNAGTSKPNPFTVDATTGFGYFYADNGRYDIQCSDTQSPARFSPFTIGDTLLCDPADTGQGCAAPTQPVDVGVTYNGAVATSPATVLVRHPFPFAVTIPQGCTHSAFVSEGAVAWSGILQRNGVGFGIVSCPGSNGACTITCATATQFAEGDVLKLVVSTADDNTTPTALGGTIYGTRAGGIQ